MAKRKDDNPNQNAAPRKTTRITTPATRKRGRNTNPATTPDSHPENNEEEVILGGGSGGGVASESGSVSSSVVLTDPDVLDCSICLEALTIPVFQCENGHIACASCCIKIGKKCPSCSKPIGINRCRAVEKIIESVKISCQNKNFGCNESLVYGNKREHENSCIFAPCWCPISNCDLVDSSNTLSAHFAKQHLNSVVDFYFNIPLHISLDKCQNSLILREHTRGLIFVLNHGCGRLGSAMNLIHIGPMVSSKYSYEMNSAYGDSKLRFQSYSECSS